MGADNFVNSSVGGKRGARRSRVLLAARLVTDQGEVDARLRDLSRLGALVEANVRLGEGSDVIFIRGATRIQARVAWAAGGRLGLEFYSPIDEQEVLVQLTRKSSNPVPEVYNRPPIMQRMSSRDRRAAMAWGMTVGLAIPDCDS